MFWSTVTPLGRCLYTFFFSCPSSSVLVMMKKWWILTRYSVSGELVGRVVIRIISY